MKLIIHDLGEAYDAMLQEKGDKVISANGKYATCQGCFGCWTKHPVECFMKDSLQFVSRDIGRADELIVISRNCYGGFSPAIKTIFDRSIGISIPPTTLRKREMHHIPRYGKRSLLKGILYGDVTQQEKEAFEYMLERIAVSSVLERWEAVVLQSPEEVEGLEL